MVAIGIKQNKKGTFLDLSKEDLRAQNFFQEFHGFTKEASGFLSGSAVHVILPDDVDINQIGGDSREIINQVKTQLNHNNISIKALLKSNNETIEVAKQEAPRIKMQEEKHEERATENREVVDTSSLPETLYVEANLRSGQLIRYPGNVFVLGDVNPSAEIIAAGDIIIWGTLRGVAHAGADGDKEAKIIAMKIEAGQIRIANRILEIKKSQNKKPSLGILGSPKKATNVIPELAKIKNNEIIISRYF